MVYGYSYKPTPEFQLVAGELRETDGFYLGIEVELGFSRSLADASNLVDSFNLPLYCKTDGSIGHGLELVSHPMSRAYFKQAVTQRQFKKMFKVLRDSFGGRDKKSCGLHVHVPKAAFTSEHLYRFMRLIYDHPESVFRFSGRTRDQMRRYCQLGEAPSTSAQRAAHKAGGVRAVAVNLQPRNTVEIRLFSSACYPGPFNRRIEFGLAAYDFTKQQTSAKRITWVNFRRFVCNRPSEYKQLSRWFRADAKKRNVDLETQLVEPDEVDNSKHELIDYTQQPIAPRNTYGSYGSPAF